MKTSKTSYVFFVLFLLFSTVSIASKKPSDYSNKITDDEILKTLEDAFRWGYPMMAMTYNNTLQYETTLNAFYNMKKAADEKSQRDKGFNAETLYSAGALDLSKEPMIFSMPAVGNRFVVVPVQDAWGNIDNVIGTRTEGNKGGVYLISGPNWKGKVPLGMKHIKVATNIAFLPGRSMVSGIEDAKYYANNIQDKFSLTPLSQWESGKSNPNKDNETNPILPDPTKSYANIINQMSIDEYFNTLNNFLIKNPPYGYDKPLLEKFKLLGIGAGLKFDSSKLSETVKDKFIEFMKHDPTEAAKLMASRGMTYEAAKVSGRFKTNYYERYVQVFGGIGGNLMNDAMYFWIKVDQNNQSLDGNETYVIHLNANQIPQTKAFWSMTLYNNDFYLPMELQLNKHMINSSNQLIYNEDGSFDFYLQNENPGNDKTSNWLPTPKEGYFIIMRVYWPGETLLKGEFKAPIAKKMNELITK